MSAKGSENGYWCLVSINELTINAKIMHTGRGRFEIIDDEQGGRYVGEILDARDIFSCNSDIEIDVHISLPKSIIQKIDKGRGNAPRSKYILKAIEDYLSTVETG
jgi:hypothetical protein